MHHRHSKHTRAGLNPALRCPAAPQEQQDVVAAGLVIAVAIAIAVHPQQIPQHHAIAEHICWGADASGNLAEPGYLFLKGFVNEVPFFLIYNHKYTFKNNLELDETTRGAPKHTQSSVLDTQIGIAFDLEGDASGILAEPGSIF